MNKASIKMWLAEPLKPEVFTALERLVKTEDVYHIAVMPDVHLAKEVCIGTVIATQSRLYPQAVGNDIGCGMTAICFQCEADILKDETAAARLLNGLGKLVPTNRHPKLTMSYLALPDVLQEAPLSDPKLEKIKRRDARVQFATLGRGNHFLEFQSSEQNELWLMVHSGSRAIGQSIATHHLRQAATANTGLKFLPAESKAGQAYLQDIEWASVYADLSRKAIIEAVNVLMEEFFDVSADLSSMMACHHNHVKLEKHFGETYWVHRKGAVSAANGEVGIIPGSMGTSSFHVEGRGCESALCSSSHGAGRTMSRYDARKTFTIKALRQQMTGIWFDHRFENLLREETPLAYKDIQTVMRAQRKLVRIVRKLRPVLSYKGT
jgi:tRNA-splicing ligase RtcB